jgi:hypothetical protein
MGCGAPMMGNQICLVEPLENSVDQNDKNVQVPESIKEVAIRGMTMSEALYELLTDKGVLTQMEVIARTRNLTTAIKVNFQQPS